MAKPFAALRVGLFAHQDYIQQYGKPEHTADFAQHQFISTDNQDIKPPVFQWLQQHVPDDNFVLRSNSLNVQTQAIQSGIGIGVMLKQDVKQSAQLIEVYPAEPQWHVQNWLVTHGDLHRSEKVQQFLRLL